METGTGTPVQETRATAVANIQESTTLEGTSSAKGENYPGCRALILQALRLGNIPEESLEICFSSITQSTLNQYNAGLNLWWHFCVQENVNVFNATIPHVLRFLKRCFNKGAAYGTLNSYRSALSQILGQTLGQDVSIKRFFKGIYSMRPNAPKYNNTWDPSIVLNYIRRTPDNYKMSIESLTYKLAVLIALATGQRVQTLANIEICNIVITQNKIEIIYYIIIYLKN